MVERLENSTKTSCSTQDHDKPISPSRPTANEGKQLSGSPKNFKDIAGKPLARWILDTLVSIELIDKIVINTDAIEELAEIGIRNGAHNGRVIIRQRPSELCGDTVSMNKIIADDLTFINAENYLMTHTTNPLLSEETVRKAIDTFHDGLCVHDSLFSVNRHQTRFYDRQVKPINHDPDNLVQTQDLEPFLKKIVASTSFLNPALRAPTLELAKSQ